MGFGDKGALKTQVPEDQLGQDVKKDERVRKVTIKLPEPLVFAAEETLSNLRTRLPTGEIVSMYTMDTFIQLAVERELRRRGITWWEPRSKKIMRKANPRQK